MSTSSLRLPLFGLALTLAFAACSDPAPVTATKPDCEAIYERCHPLDTGSGDIHECHEFAESRESTNAMCVARRASCFATCVATDAGATDGGAADGGAADAAVTDAGPTDAAVADSGG